MYSLEEIIKQNNPKGDHKDYVTKKNWETELQGKSKVTKIDISKLTPGEKQEELNKLFEGR